MWDINYEQDKILGEAKRGQAGGWLQRENAAEQGQDSPSRHRLSEGEVQTCRQAGIPGASDPEGTGFYRCTGYLKSLRGQLFTSRFRHAVYEASLPVLCARDVPAKHPFLVERRCPASGAWCSHSGQDGAILAHLPLWNQCGFVWERQACQNPSGFKTLQCSGTLGSLLVPPGKSLAGQQCGIPRPGC